jgi:CxxC motif-containing protein
MKQVVCIVCPKGCRLSVDEKSGKVRGYVCTRGEEYGRTEISNPLRTVTSTVKIAGAAYPRCPVKTSGTISRELTTKAVGLLDGVELHAPVAAGDVALKDIFGTGVDFIVTRSMKRR